MSNDIITSLVLPNSTDYNNGVFSDIYYSDSLMNKEEMFHNKYENILVGDEVVTAYVVKMPFGEGMGFDFLATAQKCYNAACTINDEGEYKKFHENQTEKNFMEKGIE